MLRPSRPMIRPFRSSEASWTTDTVVSAVCPEAVRWIATDRMFRARLSDSRRASSSMRRTSFAMSARHSSSTFAMSASRPWEAVMPGDLLELGDLGVAGGLQLLLELLGVDLAVGDRLVAARQLLERRLELALARGQALLDLDDLGPALGQVALLLGALSQELLARRDARFLHLGVRLAAARPPGSAVPPARRRRSGRGCGRARPGRRRTLPLRGRARSATAPSRLLMYVPPIGGGDQISLPTRPPPSTGACRGSGRLRGRRKLGAS